MSVLLLLLALYLAIQTSAVQTYAVQKITEQLSKKLHTQISIGRVNISFFNKIILKEVYIEDQQRDTLLYVDNLVATIGHWSIRKQVVDLSTVSLIGTRVQVAVDKNHVPNYRFLIDSLSAPATTTDTTAWTISCRNFIFNRAKIGYSYFENDENHRIDLKNINLSVSDLGFGQDSVYFRVNQLMLADQKYFTLDNLSGEFVSYRKRMNVRNLKVVTPNSVISKADLVIDQSKLPEGAGIDQSLFDLRLKQSEIDLRDLASLLPVIRGMDQKIDISGHIYGKLSELKGRNLRVSTGQSTAINCDFYINGLPDIEHAFMQLDLKNSSLDFRDVAQIRLPDSSKRRYPNISPTLQNAGIITYNGNFTGFLSDFVAYGTINSGYGRISTDLSFKPAANENLAVSGHVRTINFNLGRLIGSKDLGRVTFGGRVNGQFNQLTRTLNADVAGKVDSIRYRDYTYRSIVLDGSVRDKRFEGDLTINDKNLQGTFEGQVDMNPDSSVFDFNLDLIKADLVALKLDRSHKKSNLAMRVNANFTGNTIDQVKGAIKVATGGYANENDSLILNSLSINTTSGEKSRIELKSDFLDAEVEGKYQFLSLPQSIGNLVYQYLPSSGAVYRKTGEQNEFSLNVSIKNTAPVTGTFMPELKVSPGFITGKIDEKQNLLDLYAEIEALSYRKNEVKGYSLSIHSGEQLDVKNRIEQLILSGGQRLQNLALLASAASDRLDTRLIWNNYSEVSYSGELQGALNFSKRPDGSPHIDVRIEPSRIYVADTLWQVHPSFMAVDTTRIEIDNFLVSNKQQFISLNGVVSNDTRDQLNVRVNNFNLDNLNLVTGAENRLKGKLDGTISFFDIYVRPLFLADIKIENLSYNETLVGDLSINSKWDVPEKAIQGELIVTNNKRQSLYGYGSYYTRQDSLDVTLNAEGLSLAILGPVLEGSFENVHGDATGELKITGSLDKIQMNGDIYGSNAGLALTYLQVSYYFSDYVRFRDDSIIFNNITVHDFEGNTGIFNGSIRHDNFANMDYNLSVSSKNLQVINTTPAINGRFYGKAYAAGLVRITGKGEKVFIDGSARTLNHTALNISLDYDEEAQEYDFLRFIDKSGAQTNSKANPAQQDDNSGVFMNFDINITPEARFQLIYSSQVGDMIRAQGSGNLQMKIDPNYHIEMYGDYVVDRGDYLFTLKNVINKKFDIDRGGTIQWSGDPYNAKINLNAIYRVKASLSELFANSNTSIDYSQRIPVNCKIALRDQLTNPTIGFDIEFPSTEERIKDEVRQFLSTEEDMNKQILSLLVLGKFYTPEYLRGSYEAQSSNLVGNTASELFSNQLSNWLSQISNDFDIGVNYRPGNQISDDEIELALSTQIFNDRVTINGNISNNTNQTGTTINNNSNSIVGDFDVNVKLTNNGKLQFKAYNHSNNNIIYETSPYKQGIGLSYRENYDTFDELWQKVKHLFRRKKNHQN